jgi:hypothetical protein
MRLILHILGIIAGIYCLIFQTIVLVFAEGSRSTHLKYHNWFLDHTLPQLLTIAICLFFLAWNIRGLIWGGIIKDRDSMAQQVVEDV